MAAGTGRITRFSIVPPAIRTNSSTLGSRLTGPLAPKGDTSPAAAVFDFLTGKDAQGTCTKCHSVDDIRGKGRTRQFLPDFGRQQTGTLHEFHPRAALPSGRDRSAHWHPGKSRLSHLPQPGKRQPLSKELRTGQSAKFRVQFRRGEKGSVPDLSQQRHGASRLPAVPQISCEWREHADHEHENPNAIACVRLGP